MKAVLCLTQVWNVLPVAVSALPWLSAGRTAGLVGSEGSRVQIKALKLLHKPNQPSVSVADEGF